MDYANRSTRLVGQIVDWFIAAVPIMLVGIVTFVASENALSRLLFSVAVAISVAYYLLADGLSGGGSYAKQWLGMAVIEEKSGAPANFVQSFLRNLLGSILGPLDWIFIFGDKHQRLGDKLAGTVVIKAPKR